MPNGSSSFETNAISSGAIVASGNISTTSGGITATGQTINIGSVIATTIITCPTLETAQLQASGTISKLKGGSSGCQINSNTNNLILDINSVGVSSMVNLSVITNTDNATATITNTLATGYASNYLNAGGVSGQIYTGGGVMVIATNTSHPIQFHSNRFVNLKSLSIETSGGCL